MLSAESVSTRDCRGRKILLLVAGSVLLTGSAWGAFAVDHDQMEKIADGEEPAFITEIERLDRMGKLNAAVKRPKQELPGTLLARVMPVRRGSGTPAPLRKEYAAKSLAAKEEGGGTKTWHVVAFVCSLCLAGYAFWRFKYQ